MTSELSALLERVVTRAEKNGATSADAVGVDQIEGSVRVRLGETDQIQQARQRRLGIRVLFEGSQAITASGDLRADTLDRLVDDTCAMAKLIAKDPCAGLPEASDCGAHHAERPDLYDDTAASFELEKGAEWAKAAEEAAMAVDPRIKNSEGGEFGFTGILSCYAASGGISGSYRSSHFSGAVVPVATQDGAMERDYWYTHRRHYSDLLSPEVVGKIAAERTLRRLGAVKPKTCEVPVVFDQRMASSLIGQLASAINGYSIYRGASYLRDKLGERVASDLITVTDDGTLPGGMGTRPYDGEGLATRKKLVVENGILNTFLLDTYSARKLDMKSTGNASRSVADAPSVGIANFHVAPGVTPEAQLLDGIKDGFYVTELFGFGVNLTSGDYSQGAAGLWIVDGKLSHAVSEITIAGHLMDMLQSVEAVGDNLDANKSISSPSLRISKMMVAGA